MPRDAPYLPDGPGPGPSAPPRGRRSWVFGVLAWIIPVLLGHGIAVLVILMLL